MKINPIPNYIFIILDDIYLISIDSANSSSVILKLKEFRAKL